MAPSSLEGAILSGFSWSEKRRAGHALNGPWTDPSRQNMLRVLSAIGPLPAKETKSAAAALHENGIYETETMNIALLCLGRSQNAQLKGLYPHVEQILWVNVLSFIWERFRAYKKQKAAHPQWDETGKDLFNAACTTRDKDLFMSVVRVK